LRREGTISQKKAKEMQEMDRGGNIREGGGNHKGRGRSNSE